MSPTHLKFLNSRIKPCISLKGSIRCGLLRRQQGFDPPWGHHIGKRRLTIQQHPTESALTSAQDQAGKHSITIVIQPAYTYLEHC